ncbi:restriction endonuclease subunit S [Prevotella copri]|uniref:restriction endonuclease subunit S n=1 Tax=Segatella copri TaxID=165179 RepID=UPI0022306F80|nr:restriction endonuclease subunit S [Segatella copri]MCW4119893.1 restriction endonuclease subunit S [Segatella copri]
MMESRCKIEPFIILVDERNKKGYDYPVLGINKDKTFMPTAANMAGIDTSKYKIVRKDTFVFSGMQTGRDVCIRIGLYNEDTPALVSPAYTTFRLDTEKGIVPEFFFLNFNRVESDRYGAFISDSSVRANLDWNRFLEIEIPLPSLDEQQKVVNAWKGLREIKEQNEEIAAPLMQVCQSYIQELKHKYESVEIGPYIEPCDERNKACIYGESLLRGVTSEGKFDASKAKTEGLKFDNYKVVNKGDFAYNPSRINLGSIALCEMNKCIISPMYVVFKIKADASIGLLSEYLNLWFRRTEFQRSTLFFAAGSVRDTFDFNAMQNVRIPLPPLSVQQAIVNIYNCANEAKKIAAEADRMSREVCPALIQHVINNK